MIFLLSLILVLISDGYWASRRLEFCRQGGRKLQLQLDRRHSFVLYINTHIKTEILGSHDIFWEAST